MNATEINAMKTRAEGWGNDNPFRQPLLERLDRMGGLHRTPPTDRESDAVEAKVEHLRQTAEATVEGGLPF